MDKKIWITILLIIILIGVGIYLFYNKNNEDIISNNTTENSEVNENASSSNNDENNTSEDTSDNSSYTTEKTGANQTTNQTVGATNPPPKNLSEKEIASFSTKIYTKDSERQNNIKLTCSTLNNTDVAPGNTFSFTKTVGRSTSSKGYQKADIFTNGQKTKGFGGGNCQVSTTLYNAVLKVNGLSVTERHEHSNDVPYIKNGKDAAVAYGSYDLKFVNNLDYSIRIKCSATDNNISIKIMKLE